MVLRGTLALVAVGLLVGCAQPVTLNESPESPTNPAAPEAPPRMVSDLDSATAARELGPLPRVAAPPGPAVHGAPEHQTPAAMEGMDMSGMSMPKTPPAAGATQPATTQAAAYYTCVMHPQIHESHPGNCPICGMKLVKVEAGQDTRKDGGQ